MFLGWQTIAVYTGIHTWQNWSQVCPCVEGVLTVVSRGSIWRRLIFLPADWVPFQRKRNQLGIISSWCENWNGLCFAGSETPVFCKLYYFIFYEGRKVTYESTTSGCMGPFKFR